MHVGAGSHRKAVRVERVFNGFVRGAENAKIRIALHLAKLRFCVKELTQQFARFAAFALVYIHHGTFINAAVAHRQYYACVHIRNGVAERAEAAVIRVVKAKRADAGCAVAHPRAQAIRAGGHIQRRFDADHQRFLSARNLHQRLSAFADEGAKLFRTGNVGIVDAHNAVAGADARKARRAGRRADVGRADDHHAFGQKRYAHRLSAGDKRLFGFNRHRNGLDRNQPQQAIGQRGLARLRAGGERDGAAQAAGALVKAGNDGRVRALNLRAAGQGKFQLRLRAGLEIQRVRQAFKGAKRRRHAHGDQRRREQ